MDTDQVIGIIATVKVKAERSDEYHRALVALIKDHSTREPDCIDITVHRAVDDPTCFMLYERWRITRDRFVPEQMSKSFIKDFTEHTRDMLMSDDEVTYWSATDLVAQGERHALAGDVQRVPSAAGAE